MPKSETAVRARQCAGVVHHVDTVNREMAVVAGRELRTFDVPVGCAITLHGERVRLRLVQPWDRVRVRYEERGPRAVALAVDAESG
jgi:hypothetical protein